MAVINENDIAVTSAFVQDGRLYYDYETDDNAFYVEGVEIKDGHLYVWGEDMARVDLGEVVGQKGDNGITPELTIDNGHLIANYGVGDVRDLGNVTGEKGDDGITPTFTIENGHLFADYGSDKSDLGVISQCFIVGGNITAGEISLIGTVSTESDYVFSVLHPINIDVVVGTDNNGNVYAYSSTYTGEVIALGTYAV